MGPDDLLRLRNARPQKDEEGAARCPLCSQNAHGETVLVRCAQLGDQSAARRLKEWGMALLCSRSRRISDEHNRTAWAS
jgi:hypothetical protein